MALKNPVVAFIMLLMFTCIALTPTACNRSPTMPDTGDGGSGPNWDRLKASATVIVHDPSYGPAARLGISTLAWEDGLYISRDGRHLYAFYAPADMISYGIFVQNHPNCPDVDKFIRGPVLTMDLVTNPWGCPKVLHSDIAYTTRPGPDAPFQSWQISGLARPYRFDGGFVSIDNPDGTIDFVFSSSTDNRENDLFWGRHVFHNPSLGSVRKMPPPINSTGQEDNPHLERFTDGTLVLLFDNHGVDDPETRIQYSISRDDGQTWSQPVELGVPINSSTHNLHGHLYFDGRDWWMYFASDRNHGVLSIYRSRHRDPANISTNFDAWGPPELVIEPGPVDNGSGTVLAVGDPTLTSRGDIFFVVVYEVADGTEFDRFDADPWMAPKR